MPLGIGYWYDRRKYRYHRIEEHATCAIQNPGRFRSHKVAHLNPVRDRDAIIRKVAAEGFSRIRYWRNFLGYEFAGNSDDALAALRRFLRRHEVGPFVQINISDFKSGISIVVSASEVLTSKSARALGLVKTKGGGTR